MELLVIQVFDDFQAAPTGDRKTGQAPAASALIRADKGAMTPTRGAGAAAAEADAGTKSKENENARLKEMIERLEHENSRLENENSERNSEPRAQGRNASKQARRRQAVKKEASPLQDFLQQSSSAVKTSVASLFTPPQASKGSARPSWMNE
jgi:predicted RNase H-like nuclease (RuvC/YqgF family)